jgi:hypothetical protein
MKLMKKKAKPCGLLKCEIVDHGDLQQIPARISIFDKKGNFYSPENSFCYGYETPSSWPSDWGIKGDKRYFYAMGYFQIELPCAEISIKIFRGYEYKGFELKIELTTTGTYVTAKLKRLINMSDWGWYCGDNHTHLDHYPLHHDVQKKDGLLLAAAEGLNYVCFLRNKTRKPHSVTCRKWNTMAHFAYELGHHPVLNTTIKPPADLTCSMPQDGEWFSLSEWVRNEGGTIIMGHPLFANHIFSGLLADDTQPAHMTHYEIPINAALGKVDAFELQNNRYSIVDTWQQIWHRLLNCGFKIPLSAGTDACASVATSLPVGIYRLYAHSKKDNFNSYLKAVKQGKSFLTDGPLLFFGVKHNCINNRNIKSGNYAQNAQKDISNKNALVHNGKGPGATLRLSKDNNKISVLVVIKSIFPLPDAELLQNGNVIKKWKINGRKEFNAECEITVNQSSWFALRVYKQRIITKNVNKTELFAHTNPVYVKYNNEPISSSEDALFFLKWIAYTIRLRFPDSGIEAQRAVSRASRKYLRQLTVKDKALWQKMHADIEKISLDDFYEKDTIQVASLVKLTKTTDNRHDIEAKTVTVDVEENSYYKLSALIKSTIGKTAGEEGGYTVAKMIAFDYRGNMLGIAEDKSGGGEWAPVSVLMYTEKDVKQIQIAYCTESTGSSTFKDVQLHKIDGPFFNIV